MGNTNSTITDILQREEASLARFRRALRREHQIVFDDLFEAAYKHRAAASLAGHLLPFESFLLSMLIEEHAELMRLRDMPHEVIRLRGEVHFLRGKVETFENVYEHSHWLAARPVPPS